MTIIVKGITSKGTNCEKRYLTLWESNVFNATKKAIDWANDEYNIEYDENRKPICSYKEFETITSIEIEEE